MKALFLILVFGLLSVGVYGLSETEELVELPRDLTHERILEREFSEIPTKIRDFHAQATIRAIVYVDQSGRVTKSTTVVRIGEKTGLPEFVEKSLLKWRSNHLRKTVEPSRFAVELM